MTNSAGFTFLFSKGIIVKFLLSGEVDRKNHKIE